jgi:hypothetical protein
LVKEKKNTKSEGALFFEMEGVYLSTTDTGANSQLVYDRYNGLEKTLANGFWSIGIATNWLLVLLAKSVHAICNH